MIDTTMALDRWDAGAGGSWRRVAARDVAKVGVDQGCAELDTLLAPGGIAGTAEGAQA
ncbi:hypothetical protein [Streptacidiphilus sp. PAMC 29251]